MLANAVGIVEVVEEKGTDKVSMPVSFWNNYSIFRQNGDSSTYPDIL